MKLKKFSIDQKVTFCNRDHARKEFVSGEGTIEKLLKDHFGHKYAEIKETLEVDGELQIRTHVVPVAALDIKGEKLAKFKRCILRYEEADEKYRMVERKRFEDLVSSIFTKAVEKKIGLFKTAQAKRVIRYNSVLATLRKYALGAPTKDVADFPKEVVEAAIDGEVRKTIEEKVVDELNNS